MKRDGLLTGLVLGGLLGVTISLLGINASKSGKKEKDDQDQDRKEIPGVQKVEDSNKKPSQNSGETVEKKDNKEEETRNTKREKKKKAEKEGTSFGEDIVSKLNFSKKIAQLEESLKNLREENV